MATPLKPRRRYLTFSLRTLFVVMTALAIWLGVIVNRAREQREAVEAIEALGGIVTYDWEPELPDPFGEDPAGPSGLAWLRRLVGDEYFQLVEGVVFKVETAKDESHIRKSVPILRRLRTLKRVRVLAQPDVFGWHSDETIRQLKIALPNATIED